MALDREIQLKVLYHLCFPTTSLTVGNVNFNSVIRDRLSFNDGDIEDIVSLIINKLDTAENNIIKANDCLKVKSVGDITMNIDHVSNSKKEYRRLQKKLSHIVDIPFNHSSSSSRVLV